MLLSPCTDHIKFLEIQSTHVQIYSMNCELDTLEFQAFVLAALLMSIFEQRLSF